LASDRSGNTARLPEIAGVMLRPTHGRIFRFSVQRKLSTALQDRIALLLVPSATMLAALAPAP
jgi:hypothetical protein